MAMEGMDVEQVGGALASIGNAVNELEGLIASTQHAYQMIDANWVGQDAAQFHNQWPSFASALNQAHNGLQQLHQHLQSNLQAQEQASNQY